MAETLDIKVALTEKIEETKGIYREAKANNAFNSEKGIKIAQILDSSFKAIDEILKHSKLSMEDFKTIGKTYTQIFNNLNSIVTKASKVSAEVIKLNNDLNGKIKLRSETQDKLENAKTSLSKSRSEYNDKMNNLTANGGGFFKIGANSQVTKQRITSAEALEKNKGNVAYRETANSKEIVGADAKNKANEFLNQIELSSKSVQKLTTYLKSLETQINNLTADRDKQIAADKASGANNIDLQSPLITNQNDVTNLLGQGKEEITDAANAQEELNHQLKTTEVTLPKQNSALGKAFKQFSIYAIAIRGVRKALSSAAKTIKELDRNLTEQAMVTGKTRQQTYALLNQYQSMAKALGTTTKEVAEVTTQFLRQGKTVEESTTLAKAAISAAKVASISATESVDYLTTALNGFQLSAQDAMKVSDKFAAVAAQAAVSYEEIATALSKVASQANLAGMSIDYTTALLTKGIETTREAPETIGTALKTVIARMREMSDYGETLEGDTDVNNVETQLAYVGIALKDANGELRSTEDVLDELGKKWDTLNTNQQAAVAKALAGTRQQSRLIAMMQDYERVTELQEIAQRSEGATMAQMGTYMEGLDAAINKISVAWEEIVSAVTNSEFIIGLVDWFGNLLGMLGEALSTAAGMIPLVLAVSLLVASIVNKKILENQLAKQQKRYDLERQKSELKINKLNAEAYLAAQKQTLAEKKITLEKKKQELSDINKKLLSKDVSEAEKAKLRTDAAQLQLDIQDLDLDIQKHEQAELITSTYESQNKLLNQQSGLLGGLTGALSGMIAPIMAAVTLYKLLARGIATATLMRKKETEETKKGTFASRAKAAWEMAGSAANIPVAGWVIAAAILATILGVTIAAAVATKNYGKTSADEVNNLSKQIYELTKQADQLKSIETQFDKIDNKILKTNDDLKEMSELLDSAAESLNEEAVTKKQANSKGATDAEKAEYEALGGKSQKEFYESLTTDKAKRQFLEEQEARDRAAANSARQEQLKIINKDTSLLEQADMADAVYAIVNNDIYEHIDVLKEQEQLTEETASAVEKLVQSLTDEMSAEENLTLANNPQLIDDLIDKISNLTSEVTDLNGELVKVNIAEVMTSDDYSIKDKTEAYAEMRSLLGQTSDEWKAFASLYNEYAVFEEMGNDVLDFIDNAGLGVDKINDFYSSLDKLNKVGINIAESDQKAIFQQAMTTLADTSGDVAYTIEKTFGSYLNAFTYGTDEYNKAYNQLVNIMDNMLGESILNIGQNIDKLNNTIDSFYEKSKEWNKMSETDRTQFINDNAELFAAGGEELLKAFESGNYAMIQSALEGNKVLQDQLEQSLADIRQKIAIEEARVGDARNETLIAYLKEQERALQDSNKVFQASLEWRLEQQEAELDEYKDYLKEQQEALQESLDKRKEAYQDYFDAIGQEEEDEDYEKQAQLLQTNLNKLGSTLNGDAATKRAELENQLKELEEERLKTLRERAQEQIQENLENEVEEINEKFDKLLENNQALLAAMTGQLTNDPSGYIASLISTKTGTGANTQLEVESYIQTLRSTYGAVTSGVNWDDITVEERGNQLILNIEGKEINLTSGDQQSVFLAIKAALQEVGLKI